jgi:hypothetical protein
MNEHRQTLSFPARMPLAPGRRAYGGWDAAFD